MNQEVASLSVATPPEKWFGSHVRPSCWAGAKLWIFAHGLPLKPTSFEMAVFVFLVCSEFLKADPQELRPYTHTHTHTAQPPPPQPTPHPPPPNPQPNLQPNPQPPPPPQRQGTSPRRAAHLQGGDWLVCEQVAWGTYLFVSFCWFSGWC